ncbi:Ig-like domain-containing protein [Niabella sp.]|uniref:Ig-like domain-containing protein n=1 Tax=Niabella sp. TaxID=1962976 RepID=UPI00260AB194|nr:Ig-like domain-containing protein [Niabella sp.]
MKKQSLIAVLCLITLFLTSCSKKDGPSKDDDPGQPSPADEIRTPVPFQQLPPSSREFTVAGTRTYVDVMGKQRSKLPAFRNLAVKQNTMRGYVKDVYGRPVKGADIGIRSSIIGGTYSSASGQTDANGYYEILLPVGTVAVWGAKYLMDYESGKAPVSLFPADSSLGSFRSVDGAIKNFVLLPYGQGQPEQIVKGPYWPSSYMGGSIHLSYSLRTESLPLPGSFPVGSVILIKLTPLDLLYADEKISFTIRKVVESNELYINNIPVGRYKLELKLENGPDIRMTESINLKPDFGMQPKQALGSTQITFIPGDPEVMVWYGNWWIVPINIELP